MQMLEAQAICGQITVGKLHFYHREAYELVRESAMTREQAIKVAAVTASTLG